MLLVWSEVVYRFRAAPNVLREMPQKVQRLDLSTFGTTDITKHSPKPKTGISCRYEKERRKYDRIDVRLGERKNLLINAATKSGRRSTSSPVVLRQVRQRRPLEGMVAGQPNSISA